MRHLLKYFIWLLSLLTLALYLLLGTTVGNHMLRYGTENYLSKKLGNRVEVLSLNIEHYPFIEAKIKINNGALLSLKGDTQSDNIALKYHLKGEEFQWNKHHFTDPIDIQGEMNGTRNSLFVTGEGDALKGKTDYSFLKKGTQIEDLKAILKRVDSSDFVQLSDGHYAQTTSRLTANYALHVEELSDYKQILKHQYHGQLTTTGHLQYEQGAFILEGESRSYEGAVEYLYKEGKITAKLKGVSLEKLLHVVAFPALLSAKLYGSVSYTVKEKKLMIDTKLREARFRRTHMITILKNLTGIDILKEVYDKSAFVGVYEEGILTSMLHIDNGVNHLYLNNTQMSSKTNEVKGEFDLLLNQQAFLGTIYGTLDDPKVNIDMSKLIKYQINKKINNLFEIGKSWKNGKFF